MYQVVEKSQLITGRTPKRRHEGVQRQKNRYLPGLSDSFLETFFTLRISLHKACNSGNDSSQGIAGISSSASESSTSSRETANPNTLELAHYREQQPKLGQSAPASHSIPDSKFTSQQKLNQGQVLKTIKSSCQNTDPSKHVPKKTNH